MGDEKMTYKPAVRESIGLYALGDSASLVHIAVTPNGMEIINRQEGKTLGLANSIQPCYERVYRRVGKQDVCFVDEASPDLTVVSAIAGHMVFPRIVRIPSVTEDKVRAIVHYEAEQNVPFPLEEVSWGYRLHKGKDEELSVLLLAAKKDVVDEHVTGLTKSGFRPTSVTTSSEALSPLIDKGVIIYQEGNQHTLLIVQDGMYFSRTIPIANEAERLYAEVCRSFNFYKSQVNPTSGDLGPLFQRGLNPTLIEKLREKAVLKEVRDISFDGFDGKSCADYIALGAAILGAKGTGINLLERPQRDAPKTDVGSATRDELEFLQDLQDELSSRVKTLEARCRVV
jgi:hypothetical protein